MQKPGSKSQALVVGASGSFGGAVARELVARGHAVRALVREGGQPVELAGVELVKGDAMQLEDMRAACAGSDVIVFGFNVPYERWSDVVVEAAGVVATVAAEQGSLIVFPGNVYGFGGDYTEPLAEDAPRDAAPTPMGALRNEMERILESATSRGARSLVVRAGDFFGPGAGGTSWFNFMTERVAGGGAILDPAPAGVPHAWAYLPDLARATVGLIERRSELVPAERFHFAGHEVTAGQMNEAIQHALGDPGRRIRSVPWWALKVAALVSPMLRGVVEMRYLWNVPLRLDGQKLEQFLGDLHHTPLLDAVTATLDLEAESVPRAA